MSHLLIASTAAVVLFAGLCAYLAYRLYLAGVDLITLKAELADADKAHADTTAHMLSGRRLNAQLLQELTRVRADRSRAQDERDRFKADANKLAHAAAHLLVNRFQMPVIDGWHAADEDVRQAAWDPSPVYDALVREHPRDLADVVPLRGAR